MVDGPRFPHPILTMPPITSALPLATIDRTMTNLSSKSSTAPSWRRIDGRLPNKSALWQAHKSARCRRKQSSLKVLRRCDRSNAASVAPPQLRLVTIEWPRVGNTHPTQPSANAINIYSVSEVVACCAKNITDQAPRPHRIDMAWSLNERSSG